LSSEDISWFESVKMKLQFKIIMLKNVKVCFIQHCQLCTSHTCGYQQIEFTSYLLRFSDRIDCMKKSYRHFFIQSQSRNYFLTRGKSISSNQKSAVKMRQSVLKAFALLLAPLQSSCTEVCRVSTSLLQFSHKLAINHRQWWKVRTGLSL